MAENCFDLPLEKAVVCAMSVGTGYFLKLIRMYDAPSQLGIEEEDILSDFKLFLLEHKGKPIYSFKGKAGASFTTFITVVFRNWLIRKLKTGSKKRKQTTGDDALQFMKDDRQQQEKELVHNERESEVIGALQQCIHGLEEKSRNLVYEIMNSGSSIKDISRSKDMRSDKLYNWYYAILRNLKKCLLSKGIQGKVLQEYE
ncbi:MAG: hypothetical protein AAF518_27075 [Spirochaetota bacterium]